MFPNPDLDALLFELDERRRQAHLQRLARAIRTRDSGGLGWALGSLLLRLGAAVLGEERWLRSDVPNSR